MLRIVCPICYLMCESKAVLIRGESSMLRLIIGWGGCLGVLDWLEGVLSKFCRLAGWPEVEGGGAEA